MNIGVQGRTEPLDSGDGAAVPIVADDALPLDELLTRKLRAALAAVEPGLHAPKQLDLLASASRRLTAAAAPAGTAPAPGSRYPGILTAAQERILEDLERRVEDGSLDVVKFYETVAPFFAAEQEAEDRRAALARLPH